MIYRFAPFEFDCQQLVLTKNGTVFPLNEKPALLLRFFLQEADKIHSKSDILDAVWPDRVVTDQVVFQNISYLRSLFGNDAIKTFSKKGYQWQLAVESSDVSPVEETPNERHSEPDVKPRVPARSKFSFKPFIVVAAIVALSLIGLIAVNSAKQLPMDTADTTIQLNQQGTIVYIPFAARFDDQLKVELEQHNEQFITNGNGMELVENPDGEQISVNDFFNSPYMLRQRLGLDSNQLLLSGFVYPRRYDQLGDHTQKYLLEYLIQGPYRNWHGYLLAETVTELTEQLNDKVAFLQSSQYFSLQADAFATSELSLLHSKNSTDLDVLKHLIERLIDEDNFDVASARIAQLKQQSEQADHPMYSAYATWLTGKVMLRLNRLNLAAEQLTLANQQMVDVNMLSLQSEVNKSLAEIALAKSDFKLAQEHLFQAASQSRLANRPVQEIRAYTLLSIYASKLGYAKEKYEYLYHAKTLLADYEMDGSHYMLPFYHFALFERDIDRRVEHYKVVLSQPVTPENYWVFFSSSRQLAEIYINRELWSDALALADNIEETGRSASISAMVYRAQGEKGKAVQFAKTAFDSARTQKLDWLGLNMALMLLELDANNGEDVDTLFYRRFIEQTASYWWLERHQQRLAAVGIIVDPDNSTVANR